MPLLIERGGMKSRWTEEGFIRVAGSSTTDGAGRLEIALVNNMPDPALEDTEMQFFGLLDGACGRIPVRARLYCLPGVQRGERAKDYLGRYYAGIDELLNRQFDGVIITGTEPKESDLRKEPYWGELAELMDWAEENTSSTVLSCLAAHAGVLYSDGIGRNRLENKRFGVFEHQRICQHELTDGTSEPIYMPHSRWNEVRLEALEKCGYSVLTKSPEAGVDLFVKQKKRSLFVHFQGHPEYGARTLLKEYRRDVKRYLRGERDDYPLVPRGYFDAEATKLLADFRDRAMAHRHEEVIEGFPEDAIVDTLHNGWHDSAISVYKNWLRHMVIRKAAAPARVAMARVGNG